VAVWASLSRRRRSTLRNTSAALVVAICLLGAAVRAGAQFGMFGPAGPFRLYPNVPYDGRFTFVRLRFSTPPGGFWYAGWPAWAHGYPLAERSLMRILDELTLLSPHLDDINELTVDDPALMRYPVAYIIEVGWWRITDEEASMLRQYLQKGGFVIVDDFKMRGGIGGGGWEQFAANMQKVLPGASFVDLTPAHPIFHSFFEVNSFDIIPQAYQSGRPVFRGLYEDNDPSKRLQMIVNYNTDVSQFWEWSGRGFRSIDSANEAYKLGVNYVVYGMTH
jgi:hypothetical protein